MSLSLDNCTNEKMDSTHGTFQQDFHPTNSVRRNSPRMSNSLDSQSDLNKRELTLSDEPPRCQKFETHLFKTELCRKWKDYGCCPYGKSCQFAHGVKELRLRPARHKKFKTERCKKFLAGYCPYGARCCFVHDISERRTEISGRLSSQPRCKYQTSIWMENNGHPRGSLRNRDMSPDGTGRAMAYNQNQCYPCRQ